MWNVKHFLQKKSFHKNLLNEERKKEKKRNEIALNVIAPWTRMPIVITMSLNFDLLHLLKIKIWMQVNDFSAYILFKLQNIKNSFAGKISIAIWNNNDVWTSSDNIMICLTTGVRSDLYNEDIMWALFGHPVFYNRAEATMLLDGFLL